MLIEAGIGEGMRILDVGCGSGDVAFLLCDLVGRSGEIISVDHDADSIAIARQRITGHALTFLEGDLLELPDSIATFDAIVGRRVLMYQRDAVATIRALAKCLRPGGLMVFQEHDTTLAPASVEPFLCIKERNFGYSRCLLAKGRICTSDSTCTAFSPRQA
ncbi:class I SAM-dependent methyltransferase [Pseudomonas sp. B21_DOA]|nr:class I SAM-dependent methyltransferase [Pseudomonas sp. B21_DOA]